jgi:hypothetical protein
MPALAWAGPWEAADAGAGGNAVVLSDGPVMPEHSVLAPDTGDHFTHAAPLDAGIVPLAEPVPTDDALPIEAPLAEEDFVSCASACDSPACQARGMCDGACCDAPGVLDQPGLFQWWSHNKQACWTMRTEAILMWRSAPRNRPLFNSFDPLTQTVGPQSLNADTLESDVLVAPRLSLFRNDGCGNAIEATYLYAGNFYSERTLPYVRDGYVTAPPGLYGNSWGPAGQGVSTVSATLLGNLQSAELNHRTGVFAGKGQFLAGFRWLQWNEHLLMTDAFSSPAPPAPITDFGSDLYSTYCFNNLFGGQIGLDAVLLTTSRSIRVDGLVKAGAYYNSATQRSTYGYFSNAPFSFGSQFRNGSPAACSFVGEVGLTAIIPVRHNLDFRCGYFGLWIDGLAQPTNQLSTQTLTQTPPPSGTLDTTGGVVLQGLSLGLEGRW